MLVGGASAEIADLLASLRTTVPWMLVVIVAVTFLVLFLAFGSLVIPAKAILTTLLSLVASFGALVWIFQDGNLSGPLGFTSTGTVEATQPILMFAVAFGLATDYEVFLLSRVREQWVRTGDNSVAVATALQRTGPIITGAAVLLVVVIGSFSTSGITLVKMVGSACWWRCSWTSPSSALCSYQRRCHCSAPPTGGPRHRCTAWLRHGLHEPAYGPASGEAPPGGTGGGRSTGHPHRKPSTALRDPRRNSFVIAPEQELP